MLWLFGLVSAGCGVMSTGDFYLKTDSTAIGARIMVDGRQVGRVERGAPPWKGVPLTFAPDTDGTSVVEEWLVHPGEACGTMGTIELPRGRHRVTAILPGGDTLTVDAEIKEYNNGGLNAARRLFVVRSSGSQ